MLDPDLLSAVCPAVELQIDLQQKVHADWKSHIPIRPGLSNVSSWTVYGSFEDMQPVACSADRHCVAIAVPAVWHDGQLGHNAWQPCRLQEMWRIRDSEYHTEDSRAPTSVHSLHSADARERKLAQRLFLLPQTPCAQFPETLQNIAERHR